jgi:hypothetical protein
LPFRPAHRNRSQSFFRSIISSSDNSFFFNGLHRLVNIQGALGENVTA